VITYRILFWTVALSTVLVSQGVSQGRQTQPPADELVRQYADDENDRALDVSGYPCPADDEYRDEVFGPAPFPWTVEYWASLSDLV
jgi:hypothetical protein